MAFSGPRMLRTDVCSCRSASWARFMSEPCGERALCMLFRMQAASKLDLFGKREMSRPPTELSALLGPTGAGVTKTTNNRCKKAARVGVPRPAGPFDQAVKNARPWTSPRWRPCCGRSWPRSRRRVWSFFPVVEGDEGLGPGPSGTQWCEFRDQALRNGSTAAPAGPRFACRLADLACLDEDGKARVRCRDGGQHVFPGFVDSGAASKPSCTCQYLVPGTPTKI